MQSSSSVLHREGIAKSTCSPDKIGIMLPYNDVALHHRISNALVKIFSSFFRVLSSTSLSNGRFRLLPARSSSLVSTCKVYLPLTQGLLGENLNVCSSSLI